MKNKKDDNQESTFKNVLKVVDYLRRSGWKVGKQTVYNHFQEGKLHTRKDGLFYSTDIDKYATNHLKLADGSKPADKLSKIQEEKAQAERDKVVAQVERLQLQNAAAKGLLVPKDTFERELAQRAMIFKSDIESFCRSKAPDIIALVGGDKDRIPDLIEYMLAESAGWLNRYAADREFVIPTAMPAEILKDQDDGDEE